MCGHTNSPIGCDNTHGKTTSEMQQQATYENWLFSNGDNHPWRMCQDNISYPKLSWEYLMNGDFVCPDGTGMEDINALSNCWLSYIDLKTELNDDDDTIVNLSEIAHLGTYWLQNGCGNCGGIDITGDGNVLLDDLVEILSDWMLVESPECQLCDTNNDDVINLKDFSVLGSNW